jgi:hypothetical protein
MDVRLYDETYYLCQGLYQPPSAWLADYSALYSGWYRFLSVWEPNPVGLYYLNYRLWTALLGFIVFFLARLSGSSFWIAAFWALSATAAQLGLPLWPKAGHLALLGSAVGLWGGLKWRHRPVLAWVWVSGVAFCLSWVRPEFLAGTFLGICGLVLAVFRTQLLLPNFRVHFWVWIPFILGIGFVFLWGFPAGGSGRGMVAFGQHFVHNWRNFSGHSKGDFMEDWVNWREICIRLFGTDSQIFLALRNRPDLFLAHFWFNFKYFIWNGFQFFFETLFPQRLWPVSVPIAVGLSWLVLEYLHDFSLLNRWWRSALAFFKSNLWIWVLALPSVLAALLFQPRPHYLLPLLSLFVFGLGKWFALVDLPKLKGKAGNGLGIVALLILLWILPGTSSFFALKQVSAQSPSFPSGPFSVQTSDGMKQKELILRLQQEAWSEGSRWFDATTGAAGFLGNRIQQFGKTGFEMNYEELANFDQFLVRNNISHVLLRYTIRFDHALTRNPAFAHLRAHPEEMGWRKRALTTYGDSVLVRNY